MRCTYRKLSGKVAALIAGVCVAALLGSGAAMAGPEEEEGDEPVVTMAYPGFFTVLEGRSQQIVARILIKHEGGPRTMPLKICALMNSLKRPRLSGKRRHVRIVEENTICWHEPALSAGKRILAVIRADIPLYESGNVEEQVHVSLFGRYSDSAAESRYSTVRVKQRRR